MKVKNKVINHKLQKSFNKNLLQFVTMIVEILSKVRGLAWHEDVMIVKDLLHSQGLVLIGVRLLYEMLSLSFVLVVIPGMYPDLK